MPSIVSANKTRDRLRQQGFELIDSTLSTLSKALATALADMDETTLIPYLPWQDETAQDIPPEGLQNLYSISFQLLNMVEERVAATIRRERETELGASSIRGLWGHALKEMIDLGLTEDEIIATLQKVHVEPVLTAHPTEAKRVTVRERHRVIYDQLVDNESTRNTARERERIQTDIATSLQSLWRTGEIHLRRPNIHQELRNALFYLREVFPQASKQIDRSLTEAWVEAGFSVDKLRAAGPIPRLTFSTWIGGDRDGHPLVTADVTARTLDELRYHALTLLRKELKDVAFHLTLTRQLQQIPDDLQNRIDELAFEIPNQDWVRRILEQNADEPWRQFVYLMRGKIFEGIEGRAGYLSPDELRTDIELLQSSLEQVGCNLMVDRYVRPILHLLEMFGFHLATLDVRQNSDFHDKAVAQLLETAGVEGGADFADWSEDRRVAFLSEELESARPFLHDSTSAGDEADAVLNCYRVLLNHQRTHGFSGLGSLIVSMTRQVSDLLAVYVLCREAGLMTVTPEGLACPLEVVPLFETMDDLDRSEGLLETFLAHPVTQRSLALRHGSDSPSQQVMLGYSDSNKDCGIFAAAWALYRAQRSMGELSQKTDIDLRYFHGRGGTISRGAGPTHWFMRALPHGSLTGQFRMTEQGETVAQKYANLANATYNLELLVAGAASATALHQQESHEPDPALEMMDFLSAESQKAYQKLLNAEGFIPFYRQATPIDVLENARIGSRPSRRTGAKGFSIDDLRAIPWVFSWTQARFYLPGWFGVGSALETLEKKNPDGFRQLQEATSSSTFLRYVLTNVETNLASANIDLMAEYASLVTDEALREKFLTIITDEFHRTHDLLEKLFSSPMSERRPRMSKTLDIREDPLRLLHLQQVRLIKRWREHVAADEKLESEAIFPKLLLSINSIASGLRTTG